MNEYIVWRTYDAAIDYFVLRDGDYVAHTPDDKGRYRSEILAGFWLDAQALLAGDLQRAIASVQEGLASPEHKAFVEKLAAAMK